MNINKQKLNIRVAKQSDWDRIIDIYNQAVLEGHKTADTEIQSIISKKEWLSQHLTARHPILIIEYNRVIVGWCSLSEYRPGRKALEQTTEISYYIDSDFRSLGIGSYLVSESIDYAKQNGTKTLIAILLDINFTSVFLLEKFGFKKWGHLPEIAVIKQKVCGQFIYGKHI